MSKHNLILPEACLGTATIGLSHDVGPYTFYVMSSEGSWLTSSETFIWCATKFSFLVAELDRFMNMQF